MENLFIQTERLTIRNLYAADLEEFHFYRSIPEVTKYQSFDVMTTEQTADFIHYNSTKLFGKAGEWVQYAIENNASKQLIGDCAIKLDANDLKMAEVGITISPPHQKKGYAKETLLAILKWLFDTQDIQSVVETVDVGNIPSIRLLKRSGFSQKGEEKKNVFFKGSWGSEFQYVMSKQDWENKKF